MAGLGLEKTGEDSTSFASQQDSGTGLLPCETLRDGKSLTPCRMRTAVALKGDGANRDQGSGGGMMQAAAMIVSCLPGVR